MFKVSLDIDELLENVSEEDVGTIISMIDDKEVLGYIASEYIEDYNILQKVIFNTSTSNQTIEFIAQEAIAGNYPRHILNRLYSDSRLSETTKRTIYILMQL